MTFLEKIRAICDQKGWSKADLARKVDVSSATTGRWLRGDTKPFDDAAVRLARALRVSLDYLADDAMDEIPAEPGSILSEDDRFVLKAVHALNLDGSEALRRLYLEIRPADAPRVASAGESLPRR